MAVQAVFYAEPFGARVRYTGFAAQPGGTTGVAQPGGTTGVAQPGGVPWLVAVFLVGSFAAFHASRESKETDIWT
ncbi:hypothetical protein GCM10009850_073290 [Nonomuraea monospora]|uniref:Uncharacterized protein n=1 Tax=Nonomuraea monospora TaxID=568818 RepID=A0ABP5PMV5_9ACTN